LFTLLLLLGLGGAERAAAQTCTQSVQSAPLASDSTKNKKKKPKRRQPGTGATIQIVEPGCETDVNAPSISITPGSSSPSSASVSVSVSWQDDVGLDQDSYWITLTA